MLRLSGLVVGLLVMTSLSQGQYGYYKTKEQADAANKECSDQVKKYQSDAVVYMNKRSYMDQTYPPVRPEMMTQDQQYCDQEIVYANYRRAEAADKYTLSFEAHSRGVSAYNAGNYTTAYNEFSAAYGYVLTGCQKLAEATDHVGHVQSLVDWYSGF